ncbi:hypothetical protein EDL98_10235 [Ornithobacterium rhinotracheale]|uniref:restriction endonuclease subunit S n=1 Tax=Ornithobacterium rhinotracheale TaxID=28251 RepID=UPI001627AD95|nr:restriction endonuclease subunit S [Ornithobacterium rhinotracheale]MRJ11445.1 hypothetical protein [Ornithobacterium rhinotracheale]
MSELCVNIIEGKTPDKSVESYWNSNDVMWFTTPDFPDNTINIEKSNQFVSKNAILDNKVKIIPINSVLLSCTATLGRTGVTRVELTTNQQIKALITNEKVTPEYLSYYFKFSNFDMSNLTNNSGVKHINLSILKNIQIPVPPLAEQEKIVAQVSEMEAKIAELESLMAQASNQKKAILHKYL